MALTGWAAVKTPAPLDVESASSRARAGSVTLEHGEGTMRGVRGATLYAQWWRPCRPVRGAVAVVHGLKDHSARYGVFAERLVARGFAVHAFDLRGHGRSDGASAWVDSFGDYVEDLDAVVRCVRVRERSDAPLRVRPRDGRIDRGAVGHRTPAASRRPGAQRGRASGGDRHPSRRARRACSRRSRRGRASSSSICAELPADRRHRRGRAARRARAPARRRRPARRGSCSMRWAQIDARARELSVPVLAMHGSADVVSLSRRQPAARRARRERRQAALHLRRARARPPARAGARPRRPRRGRVADGPHERLNASTCTCRRPGRR